MCCVVLAAALLGQCKAKNNEYARVVVAKARNCSLVLSLVVATAVGLPCCIVPSLSLASRGWSVLSFARAGELLRG